MDTHNPQNYPPIVVSHMMKERGIGYGVNSIGHLDLKLILTITYTLFVDISPFSTDAALSSLHGVSRRDGCQGVCDVAIMEVCDK